MNILAHVFLAGDNDSFRIGGFIADYVKGKSIEQFSPDIRKGIMLHRLIDSYTDKHPTVKKTILKLKPSYGRYAGIITDIFFDHFLNKHWEDFSDSPLKTYVREFYILVLRYFNLIPQKQRLMLPFLIYNNWLESYGNFEGLQKRLAGMSRRINNNCQLDGAVKILLHDYKEFDAAFMSFFPELLHFSITEREKYIFSN